MIIQVPKLKLHLRQALLCLTFVGSFASAIAQTSDEVAQYVRDNYTKTEVMIPMRDGVRLFTAIYTPKDSARTWPIMLKRTPYSCSPYGIDNFPPRFQNMEMARSGYIFVFQDVRGRYMSEGQFVDVRPYQPKENPAPPTAPVTNKKGKKNTPIQAPVVIDEATDTYDTAEWLTKNLRTNNGKIGVYGISYPGFYSTMALLAQHPAIKAVSPQAPVTNWFIGDDFHHNGAFFLMDAFSFYSGFGLPRPEPTTKGQRGFTNWNTPDNYQFYLNAGAIRNFNTRYGMDKVPFWQDLIQHPNYDDWWKARTPEPHLTKIRPAVMTVGGHFDAEDCWGAWHTYQAIEKQNPTALSNRIVMGPWIHGGWARGTGERLGNVVFGGQKPSEYYEKSLEFPFFEHYLKGQPAHQLAEATVFETGSNRWTQYNNWPPADARPQTFYFQANGRLSTTAPTSDAGTDRYTSDPARPVPYTDQVHLDRTRAYMTDDQRFASRRTDVLVYQTEPLATPLTVTGPVMADLLTALRPTATTDSLLDIDFIVKLIDVFPDTLRGVENGVPMGGYQMLVRGEIMRGRFREQLEQPKPFRVAQPDRVKFELPDVAHTFLPGHRLMVQVQSTWFPLTDRNPQRFVPNIYEAYDSDFIPVEVAIDRNAKRPSSVTLMIR
jgi:uncharacterized protein